MTIQVTLPRESIVITIATKPSPPVMNGVKVPVVMIERNAPPQPTKAPLSSTAVDRVLMTLPPAESSDDGFCPAARIERPQFVLDRANATTNITATSAQKIADCRKIDGPTAGSWESPGIAQKSPGTLSGCFA